MAGRRRAKPEITSYRHRGEERVTRPPVGLVTGATDPDAAKWLLEVHGFDYFNTRSGGVDSGGADHIAVWMLDADFDSRSLFPEQVFFPIAGARDGWARLARNLKAEIDTDLIEAYRGTESLPFEAGEHGRVVVKIVDDRGIESLKAIDLDRIEELDMKETANGSP